MIASTVLVAGCLFLVHWRPWEKKVEPITFSTVQVSKGPIAAQVTATGTLSARTTVQVGAQVSGRVIELHADFNDTVKKGQIVAKLDPELFKENIDQAQASYNLALANEKKAEVAVMDGDRQYKRQLQLQQQQLVAAQTVETAEVTWKSAVASLAAAKASVGQAYANLAQAKTQLDYTTIYSPVDGVVLTRSYDIGQTVQSSFSAPTLFTIAADLSIMQIDTAVAEADVGRLVDGMKSTFAVDAFPGRAFEGTVRQVRNNPTTTSGVVTYDAVIDVDNHDHSLRPGMTANVTFVLAQVADTIKIPNAALRFKLSREQMMALREAFGGGSGGGFGGSGHRHRGSGSDGSGGGGDDGAMRKAMAGAGGGGGGGPGGPPPGGGGGGPGGPGGGMFGNLGDKKVVWKLVDGRPRPVVIKPGLTDGSSTQVLEGELEPGDQLVTEVQGLPTTTTQRKLGAF